LEEGLSLHRHYHELSRSPEQSLERVIQTVKDRLTEPGFAEDLDTQMSVVGAFAAFRDLAKDQFRPLEQQFCEKTGLSEPRFLHLLLMPSRAPDPLEALRDIRLSLKATRTELGPLLPGEEIYPRYGFLGQYLNYTQETTAPMAYHFWLGVALIGAACRRAVYMDVGTYLLYPNQYLFLVGQTAEGKGIAFGRATPLVRQANDIFMEVMATKDAGAGPLEEGHYPNRQIVVLPNKPTPQQLVNALVPRDDTPEESQVLLKGLDSVGWLASEEVSGWMGKRDSIYDGCVNIITEFYNCGGEWTAGTITRGCDSLKNMCLSVVCASNLEWINKAVTPDMFAGGFIRRCLFVNREHSLKRGYFDRFAPPADPLQRLALANEMAVWMMAKTPIEVGLASEAMAGYEKFTRKLAHHRDNPENPKLGYYYLGKYNFVMKLAIALVVSRNTGPGIGPEHLVELGSSLRIEPKDLELAIALVEYEEEFMRDCFERIGEHHHMEQYRRIRGVVKECNTNHGQPIPASHVRRIVSHYISSRDAKIRIEELVESGELRRDWLRPKKGRATEILWVPEALKWPPSQSKETADG